MTERKTLQKVSQFGVEFRTRKHDRIDLENFLSRTYRCSTYSLAEYLTIYFGHLYVEESRLLDYCTKCIDYLSNLEEGDIKLSNKNNYILYKMKRIVNDIKNGTHSRGSENIKIHFEYYDLEDCILGNKYSEEYFKHQDELLKRNYDINFKHFNNLDSGYFENALCQFQVRYPEFYEIGDLKEANFAGWYILVLDDYKQVYVGQSYLISSRIKKHWTKTLEYDRRIVADFEKSKISIDSFGYKDTTRILVARAEPGDDLDEKEIEYIDNFPNEYLTNRIRGGKVSILTEVKAR